MTKHSKIALLALNSDDVIYELEKATFKYYNDRSTDWVFSDKSFFLTCYEYIISCRQIPSLDEIEKHIIGTLIGWQKYQDQDQEAIRTRTRKLVMDFFRDLHTMGLLASHFSVFYEAELDTGFNVDYVVVPKKYNPKFVNTPQLQLGIAAAMQHPRQWRNSEVNDISIKKKRRGRRNCKEWKGKLFWLTNRTRPFSNAINGVWLFGPEHINDLIDDIEVYYNSDNDYF